MNENINTNPTNQAIPTSTPQEVPQNLPVSPNANLGGPVSNRFFGKRVIAGVIIFILLAIGAFYFLYPGSSEKEVLIAEVNQDKIYNNELVYAQGLLSRIEKKDKNDPEIKKKALDLLIEYLLLKKEAQNRNLEASMDVKVNDRLNASIFQYGDSGKLEQQLDTNVVVYKKYLFTQAIKESLEPLTTQWKVIDYLTIRYNFDDNAPPEEMQYRAVVDKKIQEYYTKIKNGLDIKEAIKQRCLDAEINSLPYDKENKVYTTSFNGVVCREQEVNIKVSKDTNPEWGDTWLKKVFAQTKKGQISPILNHTDKNLGMYFIINVLDEGGGEFYTLDDHIASLKKSSVIKIY